MIRAVGRDGLLLEVDDPAAWYRALVDARRRGDFQAIEIVPAASTVLLAGIADVRQALAALETVTPQAGGTDTGEVDIPVHWDGEDIDEVQALWGRDPREALMAADLTVAFCGFAPGFAYLTGLAEELQIPRRATPRTRVPKGSLATAGPYVGFYPRATPGGWHLLGHTDAVLFDPAKDEPALLTPGTKVRLRDA